MKSKEFKRRAAAWVMAVTMMFTQTPIATLAEDVASASTEMTTEDHAAEEARKAAQAQAAAEAEAQAKAEAEAQAKAEAEAQAKAEAEAQAAAEAEAQAKAEAEAQAAAEAEAQVKAQEQASAATEAPTAETAAPETEAQAETQAIQTEATNEEAGNETTKETSKETDQEETETEIRLNTVTFRNDEGGAKVYIDNNEAADLTSKAKDGKIVFTVKIDDNHDLVQVLVDGVTPARQTENADEYIIEGIQTDSTVVVINTTLKATDASTDNSADETSDKSEDESETETETEAAMPAQSWTETSSNGIKVTARAAEGAFPADTKMVLTAVSNEEATQIAEKAMDNVADARGVDITFFDVNGNVIEPAIENGVSVKMTLPEALDGENFTVVHEDGEVVADASASSARFTADSFSIYVIAAEEKFDTYVFKDADGTELRSQKIKAGDYLYVPESVTNTTGEEFIGWFVEGTNTELEFDEKGTLTVTEVTGDATIYVVPKYNHYFTATFYDEDNTTIFTKRVTDENGNIIVDDLTLTSTDAFKAFAFWTTTVDDEATKVANNTKLTSDISLYPYFYEGYFITFDSNKTEEMKKENADVRYTSPEFVKKGEKPVKPEDPTSSFPAYEFAGWYTTADCRSLYDFNKPLTGNVTVYAKWNKVNAPYKIVIWEQNVTDKKDATTKTYSVKAVLDGEAYKAAAGTKPFNSYYDLTNKINTAKTKGEWSNSSVYGFELDKNKTRRL